MRTSGSVPKPKTHRGRPIGFESRSDSFRHRTVHSEPEGPPGDRRFLELLRGSVLRIVKREHLDLEVATGSPDAESFCPVCLGDYRSGYDYCADCGVPTTRYARETLDRAAS